MPHFIEQSGVRRDTSAASKRAVLSATGLAVQTARDTIDTWASLRQAGQPPLPPTWVQQTGRVAQTVALPTACRGQAYTATCTLEDGTRKQVTGYAPKAARMTLLLPWTLPHGYHALQWRCAHVDISQALIITPARCYTVADALGPGGKTCGVWANLYSMRSTHNWGIGDFRDLQSLVTWSAQAGANFVGINPLHALRNRGDDISPYSPISRLYKNPLYLDVASIEELPNCPEALRMMRSKSWQAQLGDARRQEAVDYESVRTLKMGVLRALHAHFSSLRNTPKKRAYRVFLQQHGKRLHDYAVFCALDEHFVDRGNWGGWNHWPQAYRRHDGAAVSAFAQQHASVVDFHCYLQFEIENQLAQVTAAARTKMAIGLYQDLAIGTAPGGAEPWVFPHLFVPGISVGAPPDYYARQGQDWGLPPLHPQALRADGYSYFRLLLQSVMGQGGALRLDHAMGMMRLFWIPRGQPAKLGAYVRYPLDDMLSILALESVRHRSVVIGEDLGTVPAGFGAVLRRYGILSSKVMYFETSKSGAFRAAARYSDHALVTATTHDHAPLRCFFTGADCDLRRRVGNIANDAAWRAAKKHRAQEITRLVARLKADKCLPHAGARPLTPDLFVEAVHKFLRKTPAPLVGISLDDIVGETQPVNMPGVGPTQFPSWKRRIRALRPTDKL